MRMSNKAKAFFEEAKLTEEYWVEKAKMDFSMELARNASNLDIKGKTLAEKIGTSAAYISKVFRGQSNLTIDSMVKLARATGANVEIKLTPLISKDKPVTETIGSCQIIPIPTPLMNRLTKHKTEVTREHVMPSYLMNDTFVMTVSEFENQHYMDMVLLSNTEQLALTKTA